jgi:hypothetical protein
VDDVADLQTSQDTRQDNHNTTTTQPQHNHNTTTTQPQDKTRRETTRHDKSRQDENGPIRNEEVKAILDEEIEHHLEMK